MKSMVLFAIKNATEDIRDQHAKYPDAKSTYGIYSKSGRTTCTYT